MSSVRPLSKAAQENISVVDENFEVFHKVNSDRYNRSTNPKGVLNMGIAVNKLQENIVVKKLNTINQITTENLEYGNPTGSEALRTEIADLTNRHFNTHEKVSPDQIIVTNGVTSAIDVIASIVTNPGDAALVSTPYYAAFDTDINLRSKAVTYGVNVPISEGVLPSQVKYFEEKYNELTAKSIETKLLIICNPQNPTGRVYPKETLRALLRFASKRNIFVLVDEIYALSVYRAPKFGDKPESEQELLTDFESVLSWPDLSTYIDPRLVFFVHGMSKDFCMNGIRMGWIISPWNKDIIQAAATISIFSYSSSVADTLVTRFLADHDFIDNFIKLVAKNLKANYVKTTNFFKANNVEFVPAQAGHFIWTNFRQHLFSWKNNNLPPNTRPLTSENQLTFEDDKEMWYNSVFDAAVCYTSGANFHSAQPGWARVIFAIPWDNLSVGLNRFITYANTPKGKGKPLMILSKI